VLDAQYLGGIMKNLLLSVLFILVVSAAFSMETGYGIGVLFVLGVAAIWYSERKENGNR
jgi:hypothetical protein